MKKSIIFILILILINVFHIQVDANSAPPENVRVNILNIDQPYELDFLIPFTRALNEEDLIKAQFIISDLEDNDYFGRYYQSTFPSFLIDFQDKDGYVSHTLYGDSDYFYRNEHQFGLYMNVPRVFKIVLIHNEQLIISETIVMQAYDESFTWDLEGITFSETGQYNVGQFEGLNENPFYEVRPYQELIIRIIVTIIIELLVFYFLGYRLKQTYIKFGILNIITQTLLTLGLIYGTFIGNGMFGNFLLLVLGEILVFGFEMGVNGLTIKEKYTAHVVFSTFLANLASLIFGTMIALQLYSILL